MYGRRKLGEEQNSKNVSRKVHMWKSGSGDEDDMKSEPRISIQIAFKGRRIQNHSKQNANDKKIMLRYDIEYLTNAEVWQLDLPHETSNKKPKQTSQSKIHDDPSNYWWDAATFAVNTLRVSHAVSICKLNCNRQYREQQKTHIKRYQNIL